MIVPIGPDEITDGSDNPEAADDDKSRQHAVEVALLFVERLHKLVPPCLQPLDLPPEIAATAGRCVRAGRGLDSRGADGNVGGVLATIDPEAREVVDGAIAVICEGDVASERIGEKCDLRLAREEVLLNEAIHRREL